MTSRIIALSKKPEDLEETLCGEKGLGFKREKHDRLSCDGKNGKIILEERGSDSRESDHYVMILIYIGTDKEGMDNLERIYTSLLEKYAKK